MTITQPPRNEVEKLIRRHMTMLGVQSSNLALAVPTLNEVKAAIATGPTAGLEALWVEGIYFKDVIGGKNRATIQSFMKFKTVTLSRITHLEEGGEGSFSFIGSVRRYDHGNFRQHGSDRVRGYSEERYKVSFDPRLDVHSTYERAGFSQGTEIEGEER